MSRFRSGVTARRVVPRVSMDTEGAFSEDNLLAGTVIKVNSATHLEQVQQEAQANNMFVLMEFRQEFCRKCMALAPRFRKLPQVLAGRNVMFVEVDAMKLGKEVRVALGIKVVPTFRFYKDGAILDELVAKTDISKTIVLVVDMVNKFAPSEISEENRNVVEMLEKEMRTSPVRRTRPRIQHAPPGQSTSQVNHDALAKWRQAQTRVIRAPGTSQTKESETRVRMAQERAKSARQGSAGVDSARSPPATTTLARTGPQETNGKSGSKGGQSAKDLLEQLQSSRSQQQPQVGKRSAPPTGGVSGGGLSKDELLAQLKALEDNK